MKNGTNYMFQNTLKFKFLNIKNYIGFGWSYDDWCITMGYKMKKLMFPYQWLDGQTKGHSGPACYEYFYSSLKGTIAKYEYEQILKTFKEID